MLACGRMYQTELQFRSFTLFLHHKKKRFIIRKGYKVWNCFSKLKYSHGALMVSTCRKNVSPFWYIYQTKHFFFCSVQSFLFFSNCARLHTYSDRDRHSDAFKHTDRLLIAHVCVFPTVWTSARIWDKSLWTFFSLSNREIVLWSSWISCTTPCASTSPCTEWVSAFNCCYSFHHCILIYSFSLYQWHVSLSPFIYQKRTGCWV